ncbi:MAG: chromosomal replication initiation ATPase DnaA [Maricaulis maris]|jgi:chromosomal replication initiation ATPase DnaA|uniref:Regulatory inactivation of DnaA Hda protein n=2 Tax=Maricaulis maris TaxID=74318 RepID=Q0AQ96_MARMM|nr:regulatory inactivation of DnaA Hda protein [Maricaulis maris MCS10]
MMMSMTPQMALDLPARQDFSAAAFIAGPSNAAARDVLGRPDDWPRNVMALIGPEGAGKSHLAAIWAGRQQALVLPASTLGDRLAALEPDCAMVVEDVDQGVDDDALFHLFNRAAEGAIPALLLTARTRPAHWTVSVPDLVSRLRALVHVDLHEADDVLLTRVLEKQLADRGAPVRPGVIDYLLPRMERSVAAVRILAERMDKLALVKKTPITRAIAREILDSWTETGDAA